MRLYHGHRVHYLVYALQHGLKPPSAKSMDRSDRRNFAKSGETKADKVIGRRRRIQPSSYEAYRYRFDVPKKFGSPPVKLVVGRERRGAVRVVHSKEPVFRKRRVFPPRKPISLPAEFVAKTHQKKVKKAKQTALIIRSPQWT